MSKHHSKFWGAAAVVGLALALSGAASAGDFGCARDDAGECYERGAPRLIHKRIRSRITTEQGVYEIAREPARYGWTHRPVYEWRDTEYQTIVDRVWRPAHTAWEKRWVDGRYVKCRVRVPAGFVEVKRRVIVPGGHVATGEYVTKRILLKQYKNIAIYHRARHEYVTENLAIQPE